MWYQPSPSYGEGGPRERWMRWKGESHGYRQGGSGCTFLPPLKERARRERRQAARHCQLGTDIEATSKSMRACSQGALPAKKHPLRRANPSLSPEERGIACGEKSQRTIFRQAAGVRWSIDYVNCIVCFIPSTLFGCESVGIPLASVQSPLWFCIEKMKLDEKINCYEQLWLTVDFLCKNEKKL